MVALITAFRDYAGLYRKMARCRFCGGFYGDSARWRGRQVLFWLLIAFLWGFTVRPSVGAAWDTFGGGESSDEPVSSASGGKPDLTRLSREAAEGLQIVGFLARRPNEDIALLRRHIAG